MSETTEMTEMREVTVIRARRRPTTSDRLRTLAVVASAVCLLLFAALAPAAESDNGPVDPFANPEQVQDFAAELEFFKVESDVVTSVSRHPESLWGSAAAIYVVTGDDIRKSGAETIADALRMVPGVDVASVDRNLVAISARGFNDTFADKMLVLLDGRPIYTPTFGGVLWHQWNTFLPDLDRIEVIRGPGGTLWGSNAVNGVINIITKRADDTRGVLMRGIAGDNAFYKAEARLGARSGNFNYRVFGRYSTDQGFGSSSGDKVKDDAEEVRAGYRFDWDLGEGLRLMSTAELYDSRLGSLAIDPGTLTKVTAPEKYRTKLYTTVWRLEKDFADGSSAHLQLAGDYVARNVPFLGTTLPGDDFRNIRRSWELEFQHTFRPWRPLLVTWGGNFRQTNIDVKATSLFQFDPRQDVLDVAGGFVQGQVSLWEGAELTLGTKVEDNTFTGTNFQPSGRFVQRFGDDTTVWGAVSRASNTPSYGDESIQFTFAPDTTSIPGSVVLPIFASDGTVGDTKLIAYELGFRHRLHRAVSLDVAAFYNDYDGLQSFSGKSFQLVPSTIPGIDYEAITLLDNGRNAYSYGVESVLDVTLNDHVHGEVNASWQQLTVAGERRSDVPEWKVNVRPIFDIMKGLSIVPTVHWVDRIAVGSDFNAAAPKVRIADYARFDLAIHYQPEKGWPTFSLVGQNLQQRRHVEWFEELVRPPTPVTRTWFFTIEQEF